MWKFRMKKQVGIKWKVAIQILKQVQDDSLSLVCCDPKRHAELVSASHRKVLTFSLN